MTTYSHREALELICALGGNGAYSQHGHAMSLRIARAALLGHAPELSSEDWEQIERNWPKGKPFRMIGRSVASPQSLGNGRVRE